MGKHILLVEDEFFIRDLYTIILTKAGHLVDTAEDGEVAITKAVERKYDLILLDIMLPKATGVDVLRTIRSEEAAQSKTTPVIVVTNLGQQNVLETIEKIGVEKILFKAKLSNEELVNEVHAFFKKLKSQS